MGLLPRRRERAEEATAPADHLAAPAELRSPERPPTFLPRRDHRPRVESVFMRLIATGGIVGIGTAIAAIMASQEVAGWILGIVVAGVSVILAAVLWSASTL